MNTLLPRWVVDTNVFVGACLGTGAASAVVRACLTGLVQPLIGAALLHEFEDVLSRDALMRQSHLSKDERSELLDIFVARCEWVRVYFSWRPNLRDEADNHLIELAVAGAASAIVTRNVRDFALAQLHFPSVAVLTPPQALALL